MNINKFIKENKENMKKVDRFLKKIGMNKIHSGYRYWNIAIVYFLILKQNNIYITIKMEDLYNFIAQELDKNKSCVEAAMRLAVRRSNYIKQMQLNHELTNKQFLYISGTQFLDY